MIPQLRRGQRQHTQAAEIPASTAGINAIASLARMNEDECIFSFNILGEDFGMEVRDGYREWANGWTGGFARTVITFEGNIDAEDRMWVANDEGIWDVTVEGTTNPTQDVVFPSGAGNAGICSYVTYGNDNGDRFVLLCDGENGYYTWEQTTDTWTKVAEGGGGGITGTDPALFDFFMIWKTRVWFIQRDTGIAWFLDKSATFLGTVNEFNWGDQFRYGGRLVSLHNWTLDGGNGIDDYLVGIGAAGDVIVYQGTDPTSKNDFGLVGSWYVGQLPFGNRIASEYAGELYILSIQGLIPLSKLLNGAAIGDPATYVTAKISPYIRLGLDTELTDFGWQVHIQSKQSRLYINAPILPNRPQLAFTMYFGTGAWGIIDGLPKAHTADYQGEALWTDSAINKIYIQVGNRDKVYLNPEVDGESEAITWSVLTAYQKLGQASHYKRMQYIRPIFVGGQVPAYSVRASYDYDISEFTFAPVERQNENGLWNIDVWDIGLWSGGIVTTDNPRGANGLGRHMAVSIKGRSSSQVTLIAFDVAYDEGGIM